MKLDVPTFREFVTCGVVLIVVGLALGLLVARVFGASTAPPTTLRIAVGLAGQAPVYIGQTSHLEWIGEANGTIRVRWTTPTGSQELVGADGSFVVQAIGHLHP